MAEIRLAILNLQFFFCRQLDAAKFMDVEIAVRVLYMVGEAMSVRGLF